MNGFSFILHSEENSQSFILKVRSDENLRKPIFLGSKKSSGKCLRSRNPPSPSEKEGTLSYFMRLLQYAVRH